MLKLFVYYFDFLHTLSKNLKRLATHILKTFVFCLQAVNVVLSDESLPNDSVAPNSLPTSSGNGETSDNAPSVSGKSSDKAVDVSVPETSTFTSGIQSICVRGGRPLHISAIQYRGRGVRARGGPARACGCGVCTHGGAARARGCGTHNINRNTVTWDSLDGAFINPNSQKVYLEHPGPSRAISSVEKPMNIFMHLLTDNVFQIICHETNRYHQQNAPNDNYWNDVTPTEMIAFFRVNITMGILRLPKISDYWKRSGVLEVSWFRSIFRRKRFMIS